jgi:predicted site-specific integrase-resolvase
MDKVKRIYPGKKIKDIRFYKTEDLVKILGLCMLTVRKYLKTGRIKGAIKVGKRYYLSTKNLDRFLGKE